MRRSLAQVEDRKHRGGDVVLGILSEECSVREKKTADGSWQVLSWLAVEFRTRISTQESDEAHQVFLEYLGGSRVFISNRWKRYLLIHDKDTKRNARLP